MVSSGFFKNIRRDYVSDTTSSEDENSPRRDIVSITPPAYIVNLRKLFTDSARHHPTLVSELKVNGFDEYFIRSRFFDDWYVEKLWFKNVGTRKRKKKTLHITFRKHSTEDMVSSGFYKNIRRDYESDTTTSEDEIGPRRDIVWVTSPARAVREGITHSVGIVNLRKLFTDLARHHPTLVSELKIKIVLKVLVNDPKSRTRSMTISVGVPGVTSVEQDGEGRHLLLVTGVGMDAAQITRLLRKKIGAYATGFTSVEVDGEVRGLLVVTSVGIDASHITALLREKIGYTELLHGTPQLKEKEAKTTNDARGWPWFRALRRRLFFLR